MHRVVAAGVASFEQSLRLEATSSLSYWLDQVATARPSAVVLGELVPPWSGRELALSLGKRLPAMPLVGVIHRGDVTAAVRWFQAGVWDVLETPRALLSIPERTEENPIARFLQWARRHALQGQLVVYPDTPFEGRLSFSRGELAEVRLLSLSPAAVLEYLLDLGDAELRWESGLLAQELRPRVLVVEDDASIRGLLSKRLEGAGYRVTTAGDGVDGLNAVAIDDFDLMILDLHMPRLDGWQVLRTLRSDLRTRELPVVLLSAHEGDVDALKAARAGARAYLKKSGHAKDLLTAIELLTRPRRLVIERLNQGESVEVEPSALGMFWFLSLLGHRGASGLLELEDELGRYELRLDAGRAVQVVAQQGSLRVQGAMALDAIVTSRGRGRFVPGEGAHQGSAPELSELLAEALKRGGEFNRATLRELASRPERLVVHEELGALFGTSASVEELNVLNALRERRSLEELGRVTRSNPEELEDIIQHLLWRGVVAAEPAAEVSD